MKIDHDGRAAPADASAGDGVVTTQTITRRLMRSKSYPTSTLVPADAGHHLSLLEAEIKGLKADYEAARASDTSDDLVDQYCEQLAPIADRVADVRVNGVDELCIKARLALFFSENGDIEREIAEAHDSDEKILWSIVRDLLDCHGVGQKQGAPRLASIKLTCPL